jgi:thermostable 8-oxoguanine DNA glycosylase
MKCIDSTWSFGIKKENMEKLKQKIRTIPTSFDHDKYLKEYSYLDLTSELDKLTCNFDQSILDKIVLWKVNRYAEFDQNTIQKLNNLPVDRIDEKYTKYLLLEMLETKGVKIAMASTILRFKNPKLFQIIDQRVYRILYGFPLKNTTVHDKAIKMYLQYLKDLKKICNKQEIPFEMADRVFYMLDKDLNNEIKLK